MVRIVFQRADAPAAPADKAGYAKRLSRARRLTEAAERGKPTSTASSYGLQSAYASKSNCGTVRAVLTETESPAQLGGADPKWGVG